MEKFSSPSDQFVDRHEFDLATAEVGEMTCIFPFPSEPAEEALDRMTKLAERHEASSGREFFVSLHGGVVMIKRLKPGFAGEIGELLGLEPGEKWLYEPWPIGTERLDQIIAQVNQHHGRRIEVVDYEESCGELWVHRVD